MEDVNAPATHSEEVQDMQEQPANPQADEMRAAYAAFNLDYKAKEPVDEGPTQGQEEQDEQEEPVEGQEQPGITVKYNGQDVFIPQDDIAAHARKGLNYEKVEGRAKQYEVALDRVARQQGFKDHTDLINNLDQIEQQRAQQEQNDFEKLRQALRDDAEYAGIDVGKLDEYLDNHPLLKQAQETVQRSQQEQELRKQDEQRQQQEAGWKALFEKYPSLVEQVDQETGRATWISPEMEAKLQRGYDPIDAYELVHRPSILADERKKAEQAVIKAQRLNKRAQVETGGQVDLDPQAPQELTSAFSLFGIDPKRAQKYAKNFE